MSAQFYVRDAQQRVESVRRRFALAGLYQDLDNPIDVEGFATTAGECSVVELSELTEAFGLEHLRQEHGLRLDDHKPSMEALAGALCVAASGRLRWILVRAEDSTRRRRFTIAHELGHLFLEVEPALLGCSQSTLALDSESTDDSTVRVFNRCVTVEDTALVDRTARRTPLTAAELLEVKADHFASELLMPYEGIRRLIQQFVGPAGVRTSHEIATIAQAIASRYEVSLAAARRRLVKDLAIVPIAEHPNGDLFD